MFVAPRAPPRTAEPSAFGGGGARNAAVFNQLRDEPATANPRVAARERSGSTASPAFAFGAPTVASMGAVCSDATTAATAATTVAPLGTAPKTIAPFDPSLAAAARLTLGRVVPPIPTRRNINSVHHPVTQLECVVILGMVVESSLPPLQMEPEHELRAEAKKLLEAAKSNKLTSIYERSVQGAQVSGTCVICLEEHPPTDIILLPCKHQCMHSGCMTSQVRRCPLCRTRVELALCKGADGRLSCRRDGATSGAVNPPRRTSRGVVFGELSEPIAINYPGGPTMEEALEALFSRARG